MFSRAVTCLITHIGFYIEALPKEVVPHYLSKRASPVTTTRLSNWVQSVGKSSAFPLLVFGNFGKIFLFLVGNPTEIFQIHHSILLLHWAHHVVGYFPHGKEPQEEGRSLAGAQGTVTCRQDVPWPGQKMVPCKQNDEDWRLQGTTKVSVKLFNLCN